MFKLSDKSKRNLNGVHPDAEIILTEALKTCPIDFGIPSDGGVRTNHRQHELWLDPDIATNCDGFKQLSNHQIKPGEKFGMAFDIFAYLNGSASWSTIHLAMVASAILAAAKRLFDEGKVSIKLEWGGTFGKRGHEFKGWDMPHFNIIEVS